MIQKKKNVRTAFLGPGSAFGSGRVRQLKCQRTRVVTCPTENGSTISPNDFVYDLLIRATIG